jgi:molybdate-binding protein
VSRYREICVELAAEVDGGVLAPGAELPGIRELAQRWSTTATTVSRAQRELADAGVLVLSERRRARVAPAAALAARQFLSGRAEFRVVGSDDPALDLLSREVPGLEVLTGRGSFGGLSEVRRGRAHGATLHLLHHTGTYNAPFIRGLLRGQGPHMVHLWRREQGLLVAPGNPAGILNFTDLTGRRVALRRMGTGTRVLFDRHAMTAGLAPDRFVGHELDSHLDVALAVATGSVDAGVGVRSAAADLDLDFLHLTWESYDLGLPATALEAAAPLIAALHTPSLRTAIEELGGYDTAESGRLDDLDGVAVGAPGLRG